MQRAEARHVLTDGRMGNLKAIKHAGQNPERDGSSWNEEHVHLNRLFQCSVAI